jgi:wyosine [tRNA(Phe)-imidazoG37] synthetase (radical SAM superfamily)
MASVPPRLDSRDHNRDSAGLTYVYPVVSRRAGGVSVGVNLNPNNACNWRCIYCQVPGLIRGTAPEIDLALLDAELRGFLRDCVDGDFLDRRVAADLRRIVDVAISGNGEPTSARQFPEVVDLIGGALRDFRLAPEVLPRLITNGSLVGRDLVQRGLARLGALGGEAWFKVDSGTAAGIERINGVRVAPATVARRLRQCATLCPTWVQTCWFALDGRGTDDAEIEAYLNLLREAEPQRLRGVLIYGLARPSLQPEAPRLSSLGIDALEALAGRVRALGLAARVSP